MHHNSVLPVGTMKLYSVVVILYEIRGNFRLQQIKRFKESAKKMQLQVDVPTLTLYLQLFFVDGSKKQLRRKENRVEEKKSKCVKKPLDRLKGIPLRFSFFLHTAFPAVTLCQKTIIRPKTQFTISHEKPQKSPF